MAYQTQSARNMARYGYCDSYFVESVDDGLYTQRAREREEARIVKRQRQRQLAETLSTATGEEYRDDILEHMESMETMTLPDVNAIDIQTEIQWFMRPFLLDFIIEAHLAFQLLPETLYLAINLLDRYCSRRVVYKRHYQLVGCSALLIAAKFGDRKDRVPTVRELKTMCCNLYEDEMFTQMEWHVLCTLNWVIGHPTVDSFLQLAMSEIPYDKEVEHLAWYICEVAMFHQEFVSTLPSIMARSALALARCMLNVAVDGQSDWASAYDAQTVMALSQKLESPSQVLSKKYSSPHFSCTAQTVESFFARQAEFARQAAPPTPPADMMAAHNKLRAESAPLTPQKFQYGPTAAYGYITPPITPEGDMVAQQFFNACPGTPTPTAHEQGMTMSGSSYHSYPPPQPVEPPYCG